MEQISPSPYLGIDTIHITTTRWRPLQRGGRVVPVAWRARRGGGLIFKTTEFTAIRNCWGYLLLNFSPQHLLGHVNNVHPLNLDELRSAVRRLERLLYASGLVVDLRGAALSRLDVFCDVCPPTGVSRSMVMLEGVQIPFLKKKKIYPGPSSSTFYIRNYSREACVYDKGAELVEGQHLSPAKAESMGYGPDRAARVEIRWKNTRTVRNALQVSSLRDLLRSQSSLRKVATVYNHVAFNLFDALQVSPGLEFPPCSHNMFGTPPKKEFKRKGGQVKSMRTLNSVEIHNPFPSCRMRLLPSRKPRGPPPIPGCEGRGCPSSRDEHSDSQPIRARLG